MLKKRRDSARSRSSMHATYRLRCADRSRGKHSSNPVQLVVFDFDETLTLVTYMSSETDTEEERAQLNEINFESPWVPGNRVTKLKNMLEEMAVGPKGSRRTLAVLTKNMNKDGVRGIWRELKGADLVGHFSAIWLMAPRGQHGPCGMYQDGDQWFTFEPPMHKVASHKADILEHIAQHTSDWFPQFRPPAWWTAPSGLLQPGLWLQGLRPESIVLVDDQRSNFQSSTGVQVARYCKIARYNATYRQFGFLQDMGGIGAHNDLDYKALMEFIKEPWACRESIRVRCSEWPYELQWKRRPVKLIVFDFDETLTLVTFMPSDPACARSVGWTPEAAEEPEWTRDELVSYNFESPYISGSRVAGLRTLFHKLASCPGAEAEDRVLAVLTSNTSGAIAVLNLLMLAGLDKHFSAIWARPSEDSTVQTGMYFQSGIWHAFDPPFSRERNHPVEVLEHVAADPAAWLPQGCLSQPLYPEAVLLVDDERANFCSDITHSRLLRACKVARYDDTYRDCGPLNQMGGIAAHDDEDYEQLLAFAREPWEFPHYIGQVLGVRGAPSGAVARVSRRLWEQLPARERSMPPEVWTSMRARPARTLGRG